MLQTDIGCGLFDGRGYGEQNMCNEFLSYPVAHSFGGGRGVQCGCGTETNDGVAEAYYPDFDSSSGAGDGNGDGQGTSTGSGYDIYIDEPSFIRDVFGKPEIEIYGLSNS